MTWSRNRPASYPSIWKDFIELQLLYVHNVRDIHRVYTTLLDTNIQLYIF